MMAAGKLGAPGTPVARGLRLAAGVVFTALLIFAPLNFGSTRDGGPAVIAAGCAVASLLWLASLAAGGPRVRLPLGVAVSVALVVLATFPWITGLAKLTPASPFTETHFAEVVARWPYSIVWRTPANTLALTLALAVAALPLIDLARSPGWALTFSLALVGTAVAVGGLALLQNYTHATGIYWREEGRMPGNFCGTFYHHTAAGAYFNTAWPLAVTLTWLAWHPREGSVMPLLAIASLLATIILLAAHGSHVSRFPQVTALLVTPFLLRSLKLRNSRRWLFAGGAVATIVLLIVVAGRPTEIRERWQHLFAPAPAPTASQASRPPESAWPALMRADLFVPYAQVGWQGARRESWRTALRSIAERPLTGHGPGNWMAAASQHTDDPFIRTFFQFLQFTHQDLLQFAVEWGLPATVGWWGLLVGGLIAVIRARAWLSAQHRLIAIAAACGLAAVLLQAQVDFPLEMPAVLLNVVVLVALCWAAAGGGQSESSRISTAT